MLLYIKCICGNKSLGIFVNLFFVGYWIKEVYLIKYMSYEIKFVYMILFFFNGKFFNYGFLLNFFIFILK